MPRRPVPPHNLKTTRSGKVKKRNLIWRGRRVLYLGALVLVVGVAGVAYVLTRVELPVDPTVAPLEKQTSFICSAEVQVSCGASNSMATLHGDQNREVIAYEDIPKVLRDAVIAAEDRNYFEHGGVDPLGIARAAWADIRSSGSQQGGSTITQQYVKQTYLTADRTLTRKIKEAVMAVKLEQKISKQEILARYLNTIYFGRGAYGVQAASRSYFKHDVEAITLPEAAFLAGLIRNPNAGDPWGIDAEGKAIYKERAKKRDERIRRSVLGFMAKDGAITDAQKAAALKVPIVTLPVEESLVKPREAFSNFGDVQGKEFGTEYFVDYVRRWLTSKDGGGFTEDQVLGGGLKVYTTLDRSAQKAAYDSVTSTLNQPGDPAAALVAIDDQGQVKAMMGGTDYTASPLNLAAGGNANRGGVYQPGSTFKPFALAAAVKQGYSIRSRIAAPYQAHFTKEQCGEAWNPKGGRGGPPTLVDATKYSVNTAYANLMLKVGPAKMIDMAKQLGVTADLSAYCSAVLGTGLVTPMDMASAYSTFADGGVHKSPIVVTRVELPDGRVRKFNPTEAQVLTPDQAGQVTYAMEQVVDPGGTGARANLGRPAAGKTGTTQDNKASWFVGYTPKLTTAVWMGYRDRSEPMTNVHGQEVQGGRFPAEIWHKFMLEATKNLPPDDFPEVDLDSGNPIDPALGLGAAYATPATTTTLPGSGSGGSTPGTQRQSSPTTAAASTPGTAVAPSTTAPATTAPATTAPVTTPPAGGQEAGAGQGAGRGNRNGNAGGTGAGTGPGGAGP